MNILVINAGSSSLKYQLFDMAKQEVLSKGLCERIGIDGKFKHEAGDKKASGDTAMPTHADAIRHLTKMLVDAEYGVIKSMSEIGAVGHRVVHGGEKFSESVLIDASVIKAIEDCVPLAPLHNPANLTGIRACEEVMPGVPQVAVFDTAFHQTMPAASYVYAIPYEYYEKNAIRRYGFHGTSHRYVAAECIGQLGGKAEGTKIVTCHLGNGSSLAAIKDGKTFDTSMGLSPLEGVPMGTRSGSIDPTIVEFISKLDGCDAAATINMLNKKAGVLGVSGVSSDFRDLDEAAAKGNERAKLALDIFAHSVRKTIGSYAAAMGGIDALVFTAGIGENSASTRAQIVEGLEFLGVKVDAEKNNVRGVLRDISAEGATVKTFIIPTNEELVIATDTAAIVGK